MRRAIAARIRSGSAAVTVVGAAPALVCAGVGHGSRAGWAVGGTASAVAPANAAAGAGGRTKASTSREVTMPFLPLPGMSAIWRPRCRASLRAYGDAGSRPAAGAATGLGAAAGIDGVAGAGRVLGRREGRLPA